MSVPLSTLAVTEGDQVTTSADPLESWLKLPGIELIKAMAAGTVPLAQHNEHIGLRPADAGSGQATLDWSPTPEVTNPQGNVHGGYVAMVLDDACCLAGATLTDPFLPMLTMSLQIDYLRPVRPATTYTVIGEIAHRGKARMVANAVIRDPAGALIAQATGSVTPNRAYLRS
jgi:uncharacterized protein (TIGR00369 family)